MSIEDYLTVQEAAESAEVVVPTIWSWLNRGILDRRKEFGRILIEKKQLDALKKYQGEHPMTWRKTWMESEEKRSGSV